MVQDIGKQLIIGLHEDKGEIFPQMIKSIIIHFIHLFTQCTTFYTLIYPMHRNEESLIYLNTTNCDRGNLTQWSM